MLNQHDVKTLYKMASECNKHCLYILHNFSDVPEMLEAEKLLHEVQRIVMLKAIALDKQLESTEQ